MCNRCTASAKPSWIFGCGAFFLLAALILGLLWPALSLQLLYSQLVLKEGSLNYNNWIETPIPMYMEIRMFNWTNSDQVHNHNVKPELVEVGPYVFLEKHKRVNVNWNPDNDTVSFNQVRTWYFVPERSNGSLNDKITNLNVITASVAYALRNENAMMKIMGNFIMKEEGGSLFVTKTVGELLLDGYDDPLLDFIRGLNISTFQIPFDRFGWFADRNGSETYDGRFNMVTGHTDILNLGSLKEWNYKDHSPFYRDQCSMINGTTGELWPPMPNDQDDLTFFISDICRSVSLRYSEPTSLFGISGNKWIADDRVFDNGVKYPEMSCFCTGNPSSCPDLLPGVFNISDCRFKAPAFISYPHFYLADPSYSNAVVGLNPNQEDHEFSISLEPTTGIPLEVKARMQINILLQPIKRISMYDNVPKIMVPMFWFQQVVGLDEEKASQAKLAISLPHIGVYVAYGIAGLGLILIVVGVIYTLSKSWNRHTQFINEDDDDDELRQ